MGKRTYTIEEQKQHRTNLVFALRSERYQQTRGQLRVNNSYGSCFCCLGVACDVSGLTEWRDIEKRPSYFNNFMTLEKEVMDYYGFTDESILYGFDAENKRNLYLADLNDKGGTFEEIADWIEFEPRNMIT